MASGCSRTSGTKNIGKGGPVATILALFLVLAGAGAQAQNVAGDYPARPVTLVNPLAGGGSSDVDFRRYHQSIQRATGRQFIIDNKGGAATTIGTAHVAKAQPDGYTLLIASSPLTITPAIYPNLSYDIARDLAPAILLTKRSLMLVVPAASPFRTVQEYIAYARANPGRLNFGTGGLGGSTHLPGELLHFMNRSKVTYVHYKAPPQRVVDLVAGRLDAVVASFALGMPHIRAGKLRSLGVTGSVREATLPDMPTLAEQGYPGYEFTNWFAVVAPGRTPPAIVERIHALYAAALKDPAVVKPLLEDNTFLIGAPPQQAREHIVAEAEIWRRVIRETGVKLEED